MNEGDRVRGCLQSRAVAHRRTGFALGLLLPLAVIAQDAAAALSFDNATACIDATHFEFDASVSGLEPETEAIFRIGADSDPFQTPVHRIAVNFDSDSGVVFSGPEVEDSGAELQRWTLGPIADFTLTPITQGAWRIQGRVAHGANAYTVGQTVWGFRLRSIVDAASSTVGPNDIPVDACPGFEPPGDGDGPDGGEDVTFIVAPGDTVMYEFAVNGPVFPISLFAEIGSVEPSELSAPGMATYTLETSAESGPEVIEDFIILTDEANNTTVVTVTINVVSPEEAPPEVIGSLDISGSSGSTLTAQFAVDGLFPMTLTADIGSVEPSQMNEAGEATYTLTIDEQTEVGTTIEDTITLTDAEGISRVVTVSVEVVAPEQELALVPILAPNEQSLALLFDDICPRLNGEVEDEDLADLCTRLRDPNNTEEQIAQALEAINPEEAMAATTSALRLTRVQHGNLSQRINALRSGARGRTGDTSRNGVDVSGLNLRLNGQNLPASVVAAALESLLGGGASADDVIGGTDFGRWGLFANGTVNFGDQSRTANEAGFDFDTQGITAGIDYRLRDNAFFGAALGFARVDVGFDRRGGNMDIDSWNLALFGTYFHEDRYYLDALANYGRSDYASARRIHFTDATGTVDRTARGSTRGDQISFSIAGGYDFTSGPWTIGPHAGTDFIDADVRTLREQGAGALNMIVGNQNSKSWTLNAGGHASYAYGASWGVLVPHVRLDYVRELANSRDTVTIRLAADPFNSDPSNPSPEVTLQSDRADPSYFVFSLGTSAQFVNGIAGFVNYQRMVGINNLKMSQVNFGLRFERHF
jgi:outer membrane autotransporter protein